VLPSKLPWKHVKCGQVQRTTTFALTVSHLSTGIRGHLAICSAGHSG
jgi:hypothetical protein